MHKWTSNCRILCKGPWNFCKIFQELAWGLGLLLRLPDMINSNEFYFYFSKDWVYFLILNHGLLLRILQYQSANITSQTKVCMLKVKCTLSYQISGGGKHLPTYLSVIHLLLISGELSFTSGINSERRSPRLNVKVPFSIKLADVFY